MRIIKILSLVLCTMYYVLSTAPLSHAEQTEATEPFAPFSVEGNPDKEYHFESFFGLYKYIRPPFLKIYENRTRSREYNNYMLCEGGDRRDYKCAVDNETGELVDTCDGGEVDICVRDTADVVYTAESDPNDSCSAQPNPEMPGITKGKCSYKQRPGISRTVKGTDFSAEEPTYSKYQSEDLAFANIGTSNAISWGSQYLTSSFCDVATRKVIVALRAKQTKTTVAQSGEWPLGWVDWGYQVGIDQDLNPDTPTTGTKTLIAISDALPDGISIKGKELIEILDDMYVNPGNYNLTKGMGSLQNEICKELNKESGKKSPDQWFIDLMSAPMYPPSFRQGYVRPTICVWNVCCPKNPDKCWIPDEMMVGVRRGLYYDTSISQAFGGALDELFMTYPLDQAMKIYKNLAAVNPLIRFATVASGQAIPSFIHEKLYQELSGGCLDYVPWAQWKYFTQWIDYLEEGTFLDPKKQCPNYKLQPNLTKEKGASYPEVNLSWFLQLFWSAWFPGNKVDEVEVVKYHLITVPEAMGQSIKEIRQGFYDSRDTLLDLEKVKDFNEDLSITVDDEADLLYGGSGTSPTNTRRNWGLLTCADPMFSSQLDTTVEEYALGTRVGCDEASSATSGTASASASLKCDPAKFDSIIADSPWKSVPSNVSSIVLGSAMFEGGVLNPKLEEAYAKASEATGVPCEVLAGHHFEEATGYFTSIGNPEKYSVANGGPVGEQGGLEATALSAANGLLRHPIGNTQQLITAISNFNGGGNSNCQAGFPGGDIPYNGCPRLFQGEDDPYAMNAIDSKHTNMYLLYCGDFTPCIPPKPYGNDRPGVFPVALVVHEYLKSRPSTPDTPTSSDSPTVGDTTSPGGTRFVFRPVTCGEGSLATALGCLPYTYQPFVTTLLRFLIGISGGISLAVMLAGVFRLLTSGGDSKMVQSGKDLFGAGVAGLLFVIFSVSLLRLIAADILKLPGF